MASAWIIRERRAGRPLRYRVRFRLGGREAPQRSAGTFHTMREARARRDYIAGELAAMRVPSLTFAEPAEAITVAAACEAWRASRIDVAPATRNLHRVALARLLPLIGSRPVDELDAGEVAGAIADLAGRGLARASLRQHARGAAPGARPCRRRPEPRTRPARAAAREVRPELDPPSAAAVESVIAACAPRYRLPLLVLEATGMRVGEVVALTWGDVDEARGRWRVHRTTAKSQRSRWVTPPADLFAAVVALQAREDRDLSGPVFTGLSADNLRTDIARSCRATGTPLWSPHDLRHRRVSLWVHAGVNPPTAARMAGHARSSVTLDTYSHVLVDDREVDRESILGPLNLSEGRTTSVTA